VIEFIGPLYNWLQQFTNHYLTHCHLVRLDTPLEPVELPTELSVSQSQSYMATDSRSISKSWCRAPSGAQGQIFSIVWQLRSCFYGAPSLTRGLVCLLYMLLVLTSAVFLGSESLGSRDHILLSQFGYFPFRRLLRLAGSRWRYSTPPPHGSTGSYCCLLVIQPRVGPQHRKHPLLSNGRPVLLHIRWNVLTESLLDNGYMRTHIENTSCNNCSIVACVYCGFVFWLVP
jgi:hypothetical protein